MEEPTTPGGGGGDGQSTTGHYRESDIEFLRAQAREWLEAVLGEDLDGGSSLEDSLADGYLLFRVSQMIRGDLAFPGHVESASSSAASPSMEKKSSLKYQPYASVEAFLKVCKEVGLRDLDLFNPSDAVEKKDIRRVCVCLRRFSKKGRTLGIQVPDFDNVKDTLVTPGKMPRDAVRRTQESLQHSSSRSSRPTSAYALPSNETSSLIAELRKDDADSESLKPSETDSKVHHDAEYRESTVTGSTHSVKVAEPEVSSLPLGEADEGDGKTKEDNPLVSIRSGVDSTHIPAPMFDPQAHKYVDSNEEAGTESHSKLEARTAPVEKKQVEPFRGLVVDKPKVRQPDAAHEEKSQVKAPEQRKQGLFKAHLQGTQPYVTKEGKEVSSTDENGSFWWVPWFGGAVAIAGGVAGLLFAKKRLDPEDGNHSSMDFDSGNDLYEVREGDNLYEVRAGDNLTQIAKRSGKKNWREIADRNPSISNHPNLIHPGDCLEL